MCSFVRGFIVAAARAGLLAAVVCLGTAPPAAAESEAEIDAYQKEINDWHRARIERLQSPTGYLSLAGLFPLADGENRFGSAEDNDLVFPAKAPAHAGVVTVGGSAARVRILEGVGVTTGDAPVATMALQTDAGGEPTVLAMGSFRFHVIERSGRLYLRLKDLENELLDRFGGIERFPVDESWRIEGRFEPYEPPKNLRIPSVLGYDSEQTCPGAVAFEVRGTVYRLEPIPASGGKLFFVFGDGTSGLETYGGGRFLVAGPPSEDGIVILDFNKAYNPPCAFTPFATCPLPHAANRLSVRIEAGEKTYGEGH
jgi:uncharacterized protein (DUF1684 family)